MKNRQKKIKNNVDKFEDNRKLHENLTGKESEKRLKSEMKSDRISLLYYRRKWSVGKTPVTESLGGKIDEHMDKDIWHAQ